MHKLLIAITFFLTLSLSAAEVRVFAAVSLTEALEEIAEGYERTSGDRIVFHFGASSLLARQIEKGAPADLFLSADESRMDVLAKQGLIVPATRRSVLSNTLVVVVPDDVRTDVVRPADLLRLRRLALAEPATVPAGVYAKQWLQRIGLWERLQSRVIPTENVRGALAAVESGNVDAAIVYRTDAMIARRARIAYAIGGTQAPRISYPFALLREAGERDAALRLLAHLRSRVALNVFVRHGFVVP
jgi:molybdate transport system substrate-binding protein